MTFLTLVTHIRSADLVKLIGLLQVLDTRKLLFMTVPKRIYIHLKPNFVLLITYLQVLIASLISACPPNYLVISQGMTE